MQILAIGSRKQNMPILRGDQEILEHLRNLHSDTQQTGFTMNENSYGFEQIITKAIKNNFFKASKAFSEAVTAVSALNIVQNAHEELCLLSRIGMF